MQLYYSQLQAQFVALSWYYGFVIAKANLLKALISTFSAFVLGVIVGSPVIIGEFLYSSFLSQIVGIAGSIFSRFYYYSIYSYFPLVSNRMKT